MKSTALRAYTSPYICPACTKSIRRRRRTFATAATQRPELFDLVCVGGGPAGLSLLTALRASPITSSLKLALIESQDLSRSSSWSLPPNQFSNRASSLTPSSKSFLKKIGAWPYLDHTRVSPYDRMQVWDGVSGSRIEFDWAQHSHPKTSQSKTIAYMTENANLLRALQTRLSELPTVSTFSPTTVTSITPGPTPSDPQTPDLSSWPHIQLSTSQILATRLLIGADGLNSPVRTYADIPTRGWDYDRHGLVATVRLSADPFNTASNTTAYQRFLPTGPIALLPLPGPYATLVWSTTPAHAAHLKTLQASDFAAMVNAAFRLMPVDIAYMHTISSGQVDELDWRLKHTPQLAEGMQIPHPVVSVQGGSIASFPLRLRHADSYTSSRVALVGDAAHTIHPLAGQGLNMGIGDVEALVRNIEYSVMHGQDIGAQMSLDGYGAERYAVNNRLMGVVDKLHKLYSVGSGPIVGLRSWGLEAVNGVGFVKELFMRQAAG